MYVYFIRCVDDNNFIKIGVAKNVQRRLDALQIGCPYPLKVISVIQCRSQSHAYETETRLHKFFKWANIGGEWFRGDIELSKIGDDVRYGDFKVKRSLNKALKERRRNEEIKEEERCEMSLVLEANRFI